MTKVAIMNPVACCISCTQHIPQTNAVSFNTCWQQGGPWHKPDIRYLARKVASHMSMGQQNNVTPEMHATHHRVHISSHSFSGMRHVGPSPSRC